MTAKRRLWWISTAALVLALAAGSAWKRQELLPLAIGFLGFGAQDQAAGHDDRLVELVESDDATLRLTKAEAMQTLEIEVAEVRPAPPPEPLKLPGSLFLDPNRLVHVHCRFTGEIVALGETEDGSQTRPLQYGDHVQKGQLLATVWSKEMGEKKSELVDTLSRLDTSRSLLKRLEGVKKGVVTQRALLEARRDAEADMIAVARVERTLRSWRMTDEEIDALRREYHNLREQSLKGDSGLDRDWAQTEIRAAIDGVIVEKNFNVGDIIDPADDLFKIADLRRMQVLVNVYEEDLWALRSLKPDERRWSIDLKSDPTDNRIQGKFELIGSVIDPAQRTGVVMGWLDNENSKLLVGQFVTAAVQLPRNPNVVSVPESALIEDGDHSSVFVQTDVELRQFSRRRVKVVRRCAGTVYIDSSPESPGLKPLQLGEFVVTHGAIRLGGEVANLKTENPTRG